MVKPASREKLVLCQVSLYHNCHEPFWEVLCASCFPVNTFVVIHLRWCHLQEQSYDSRTRFNTLLPYQQNWIEFTLASSPRPRQGNHSLINNAVTNNWPDIRLNLRAGCHECHGPVAVWCQGGLRFELLLTPQPKKRDGLLKRWCKVRIYSFF